MEPTPSASLLGIPKPVRARIFRYAGLTRPCHAIDLLGESNRLRYLDRFPSEIRNHPRQLPQCYPTGDKPEERFMLHSLGCKHVSIPVSLLSVCSTIAAEAEEIFYKENAFSIQCKGSSINFIESLKKITSLSKMRRLLCDTDGNYFLPDHARKDFYRRAFVGLCSVLAHRLHARTTDLDIHCRARSVHELETCILQPLKSAGLPSLLSMRLQIFLPNLCPPPRQLRENRCMLRAVKSAAKELTHCAETSNAVFPLGRLPLELQEMILSYTCLVYRPWDSDSIHLQASQGTRELEIPIDQSGREDEVFTIDCMECQMTNSYSTNCGCAVKDALIEPRGHYTGAGETVCAVARRLFFSRNGFRSGKGPNDCLQQLSRVNLGDLGLIKRLVIQLGYYEEPTPALIRFIEIHMTHPFLSVMFVFSSRVPLPLPPRLPGYDLPCDKEKTDRLEQFIKHSKLKRVTLAQDRYFELRVSPNHKRVIVFAREVKDM